MTTHPIIAASAILMLLAVASPVLAGEPAAADTLKTIQIQTTVVTANSAAKDGAISLDRTTLDRFQMRTLGESLSHVAGVQNTSFGPSSGSPTIRSLSGNRVRILSNGLSINDLSGISPNLNVNVDMDNLEAVDIYRGEASVRYGGRAIGGAIDLRDNSIPQQRFVDGFGGGATLELGTNSGNRQALALHGNLGKHWAWTLGGMNYSHGNLKIPGNTKAPIAYNPRIDNLTAAMAQVNVDRESIQNLSLYPYISQFVLKNINDPYWGLSTADLYTFERYSVIDGQHVENGTNDKYIAGQDPKIPMYSTVVHGISDYAPVERGTMPNSHAEGRSVQVGSSYIRDNFRVGLGYRALEGFYGIPGFALATKPKHSHSAVAPVPDYLPINTRALAHAAQFQANYNPGKPLLSSIDLRYSLQYADDRELVGIYRVNTIESFRHAARLEVQQQFSSFWTSVSGLDFSFLEMRGEGVQRYLPNNLSREIGLFTMQKLQWRTLTWNVGYRRDRVERRALADSTYRTSRGLAGGRLSPRDFNLDQLSTDLRWQIGRFAFVGASAAQAQRAPDVNELYAGNDHFAIMIEENGDDRLDKEVARSYELSSGISFKGLRITGNYYQRDFKDYLYLAHTGISRSGGFLVKEWRAADTRIQGWEIEAAYAGTWQQALHYELSGFVDLVKNINRSDNSMRKWAEGDYMPNLPTSRYGLSAAVEVRKVSVYAIFERYLEQRYLGKNINPEPAMPPYSLLQAQVGYTFKVAKHSLHGYLSGNNILNVEARPQNSVLKYLAPLPGRNISLGVKASI